MSILKMRFFRFLTIPALFIDMFAFGNPKAFAVAPLQSCESGSLHNDVTWNYTMGYQFTPTVNGQITKLGGFFDGTRTVKLYDSNYNVLASASVTSANNWSYTAITPVSVSSGLVYYVVIDFAGGLGSYWSSLTNAYPFTCNNITIQTTVYQNPSGTFNASHLTDPSLMYGLADIEFTTANKGNPPVAHWRFDEGGGTTAYNESNNASSLNILKIDAGSNVSAATAETMCAAQGGYLFVPRSLSHLQAVINWLGGGSPNDTETNKWLYIMGIYPKYNGATWISQAMNTSNSGITWHANDDGPFYVSTRTDISEPNGDNSTVSSMYYAWSGYNITWYNDISAPGYTSRYFLCQLKNDGTINGATWVQGKIGKALLFNGNSYVRASAAASGPLDTGSQITFEAWIYHSGGGPSNWQTVMATTNDSLGMWVANNNVANGESRPHAGITRSDGTWFYITGPNSIRNGWHHVACAYSSSVGVLKLYIDGSEVTADPGNSSINVGVGQTIRSPGGYIDIGSEPVVSPRYFTGNIDDVRVYNYARSADQILVDYNNGAAARTGVGVDPNEGSADPMASLVAYWPLDENTGTAAYDRSGNGNNGTITNAVWTPGKNGSALSFNGSGYYINAGTGASITSGQLTLEAWIYPTVLGGDYRTIVQKRDGTGCSYELYLYTSNGALSYYNGTQYISSYIPPLNKWTHVTAVNKNGDLKLYANSVQVYSNTGVTIPSLPTAALGKTAQPDQLR